MAFVGGIVPYSHAVSATLNSTAIHTIQHVEVTRFVQVASLTLVVYDHLLTLPEEIDFVWHGVSPKSWPRMLFFAARYACPFALLLNTFALLGDQSTQIFCKFWLFFHGWSGLVFFVGVQVISQLRIWAMYRSRRLLTCMAVFVTISVALMAVIEGFGYRNVNVTNEPVTGVHICGPGASLPSYVYLFWLPPIIVELVSICLVLARAWMYLREQGPRDSTVTRLMIAIVRHSIIYFVVVFGVYTANFYVWKRLPVNAFEIVVPITYALPSVAGNRMILALRELFFDSYMLLPRRNDDVALDVMHDGLTIRRHDPMKEFNSFFGEASPR